MCVKLHDADDENWINPDCNFSVWLRVSISTKATQKSHGYSVYFCDDVCVILTILASHHPEDIVRAVIDT